jgi:hypothetical protein
MYSPLVRSTSSNPSCHARDVDSPNTLRSCPTAGYAFRAGIAGLERGVTAL